MLVHDYFTSPEYASLSPRAVKALVDLYTQFKGHNNGDLTAAWTIMSARGWTSKDQLAKAIAELLDRGWISMTRQGGRRMPTLYAVSWLGVDYCGGKLDAGMVNPTPSMLWRRVAAVIPLTRPTGQCAPPHGSTEAPATELCPAGRVSTWG